MTIHSGFTHWKLWFSIHIRIWLAVWNMIFMTFPSYWECHHPNWRSPSFFRGVGSTTNQIIWGYGGENIWMIKCGDSCALNPFMAQPSPKGQQDQGEQSEAADPGRSSSHPELGDSPKLWFNQHELHWNGEFNMVSRSKLRFNLVEYGWTIALPVRIARFGESIIKHGAMVEPTSPKNTSPHRCVPRRSTLMGRELNQDL